MADMRFGSYPASPQSFGALHSSSPDLRAGLRPGVLGGGVFGSMGRASSSIRSGVADLPEEEDEEDDLAPRTPHKNGLKSSSEEAEERRKDEEYGMAMEMEL